MRKVSAEEFYDAIGNMDVIPRPETNEVIWETRQRKLVGKTTPGYMCKGPKAYFLNDSPA